MRRLGVYTLAFSLLLPGFASVQAQTQTARPAPAQVPSSDENGPLNRPAAVTPSPSTESRTAGQTTAKSSQTSASGVPKTLELTDFQQFVELSLGYTLPIYGASLFDNVPTTFAPVDHIPVTGDYVLGPGDELLIRAWGQLDLDFHARVDRNGSVFVPKVGNLNVAGLRYSQIHGFLTSQFARIYQNFELNVTLGELRSIDIFVVGQARRPGRYTVSALSTLTNAVFASGGPAPTGSMRRIQLKRGSQIVTEFDLYDLLINGDKSRDVVLQPEDVVYISPVGPEVGLGGQVNAPAIYELKGQTSLGELLKLAGGLSTTAFGGKVLIEQIEERNSRRVVEVGLDSAGLATLVKDGDLVDVSPLSPKFANAVTLRGNVANPGRYPWHEGMRVSNLVPNLQFLITRDYWKQQNRLTLEAQAPGAKPGEPQGNDVRRNAPDINWDYAVVQRMDPQDLSTRLIPFNLGKAILDHDVASDVPLQPGDIVTIFSQSDLRVPQLKQTKFVRLEGEFEAAGVYRVENGAHLHDLIRQAGGLTSAAYLYGCQFRRNAVQADQRRRLDDLIAKTERDLNQREAQLATASTSATELASAKASVDAERTNVELLRRIQPDGRIVLNLHPDDTTLDAVPDLALEDGDTFYVPPVPAVVSVIGNVYQQGSFLRVQGKTVSSYLRDSGGPTRDADKSRIFVVRANGGVVSKDASSAFWKGGFDTMILMPGDSIIVPEQTNQGSFVRGLKDWSTILFNFGLAAAAIKVLSP